jgi:hypothetical protein
VSNRLSQNYNRRDILKFGGAAIVGGLALTACGESPSSNASDPEITPTPQKDVAESNVVNIRGVDVDIDQVEMPDLYIDRPWADPEQLVSLTKEQRKKNASIEIAPDTQTNEGITLAISQTLERIANAGRVPGERLRAEELGLSWEEYIREYYMDPMFDGLFSVKYSDPRFAGVDETLKDYFMEYVDEYEIALEDEEWRENVTLFIETDFIEQQDGLMPTERSLFIGIETRRPAVTSNHQPVIYKGNMTVNVDEGTDGRYDIGIQHLFLERQ